MNILTYQESAQAAPPKAAFDYDLLRNDILRSLKPPLGWTRMKLARRCGVTHERISTVIRGYKGKPTIRTKPSLELTLAICKCLNLDVWRYFR